MKRIKVVAYWHGIRTVRFFMEKVTDGIENYIRQSMEKRGFSLVNVTIM